MSKVLTAGEVQEILQRLITGDEIDDTDTYSRCLERAGELITEFCGGEVRFVSRPDEFPLGWCVHFGPNDSLPSDGGVFKDYDKDVTWQNGEEVDE